jgi:hypothetical protein
MIYTTIGAACAKPLTIMGNRNPISHSFYIPAIQFVSISVSQVDTTGLKVPRDHYRLRKLCRRKELILIHFELFYGCSVKLNRHWHPEC